jgi:hypothetical protein
MNSRIIILRLVLLASIGLLQIGPAFSQTATLQITSPANNTVVSPGQALRIDVTASATVRDIWIVTTSPLPDVTPGTTATSFLLNIPTQTAPGKYTLTAVGRDQGAMVESAPLAINVEGGLAPIAMTISPSLLRFQKVGDAIPLSVKGLLPGGSQVDLTHSSNTSYSTTNAAVATVDGDGVVTSAGQGGTKIVVGHGHLAPRTVAVQVSIARASEAVYRVTASPTVPIFVGTNGNYGCFVNINNSSNVPLSYLRITSASLGSTPAVALPNDLANLGAGTNRTVELQFPASAGVAGTHAILQIKGTYMGALPGGISGQSGAVSFSFRQTLPRLDIRR